ncbi:haloalkane dehalogenase-like [Procambarus clarkii]|uniref:haloalkane dehalogenase-like n=1 Tax=Procambarus clarkii TaxID=6728 RepID=UPI0037447E73
MLHVQLSDLVGIQLLQGHRAVVKFRLQAAFQAFLERCEGRVYPLPDSAGSVKMSSSVRVRLALGVMALLGGACSTSLMLTGPEPAVIRTPESRFSCLAKLGFPWAPKYLYLQIPGHQKSLRVHYIDEGPVDARETLLLLHGTPSWSFLYRLMIPVFLAAGFRVVALDQVGFGRSDKLTDPNAYFHDLQVAAVALVVRSLDLQGVTVVMQDLGGPTGVSAVVRDPWRYHRLVLLNTWLPQGNILSSPASVRDHLPYLSWRFLVQVMGRKIPVDIVFQISSDAPHDAIKWGYGAPFPSEVYKAGPSWWPLMIPLEESDPVAREMQAAAMFLQNWTGPALLGYTDGEVFTIPGRPLLQRVLPGACQVTVPDAGHFLQEDQGPTVASLIVDFIERGC